MTYLRSYIFWYVCMCRCVCVWVYYLQWNITQAFATVNTKATTIKLQKKLKFHLISSRLCVSLFNGCISFNLFYSFSPLINVFLFNKCSLLIVGHSIYRCFVFYPFVPFVCECMSAFCLLHWYNKNKQKIKIKTTTSQQTLQMYRKTVLI